MKFTSIVKKLLGCPVTSPKMFTDYYGEAVYANMLSAIKQAHSGHCRTAERFIVQVETSILNKESTEEVFMGKVEFKGNTYFYLITHKEGKTLTCDGLFEVTN